MTALPGAPAANLPRAPSATALPTAFAAWWAATRALLREPAVVLALSSLLAVVYFSWGLGSWKFAFVGDEWATYERSRDIAASNFHVNPLTGPGVYQNYVLGFVYQAVILKVLGPSNFAWRFSNALLIVPISVCGFLWLRPWFGARAALLSTLLLQTSYYLANFFKIGYVNPQALALLMLGLYLASRCGRDPSARNFALLGASLGLSFYVYIGPLIPFIIWPYLLPLLRRERRTWPTLGALLLGGAIALALVAPALLDPEKLKDGASKTVLQREFSDNRIVLLNVWHTCLSFFGNYGRAEHFVSGPYLDVVSRVLTVVGMGLVLLTVRRAASAYLALSYLSTVVILGVTSPYPYVPTTRGMFVIPFGLAFAGIALAWHERVSGRSLAAPSIAAALLLNVYQSQVGYFKEYGYNGTGLVLREMQRAQRAHPGWAVVLRLSPSTSFNPNNLLLMREAYGLTAITFRADRGERWTCQNLAHTELLWFPQDGEARRGLAGLAHCGPPGAFELREIGSP